MRNFEKAKKEGFKILERHPQMDLRASELRALIAKYSDQDPSEGIYHAVTDLWLAGLSAGYRMGKKDASTKSQTSGK